MSQHVLGLDIGGANLKAATPDGHATSVPFPLWKRPDALADALAELLQQFEKNSPAQTADTELAVTMTGELCDCFETKTEGVAKIVDAVVRATGIADRRVRFWTTEGKFVNAAEAVMNPLVVAAANWHATATFVGNLFPAGNTLLIDIGSTTTDLTTILDGIVSTVGKTDPERLASGELIYFGARRTPVCALMPPGDGAAELFATALDVHLLLGNIPEDERNLDTADGRPATRKHAHARLSRMLGGDPEITSRDETERLANTIAERQTSILIGGITRLLQRNDGIPFRAITCGSGEFLSRKALAKLSPIHEVHSLSDAIGEAASSCAPAYAVACLARESSSLVTAAHLRARTHARRDADVPRSG